MMLNGGAYEVELWEVEILMFLKYHVAMCPICKKRGCFMYMCQMCDDQKKNLGAVATHGHSTSYDAIKRYRTSLSTILVLS
jgi:hypothetical protein